MRDQQAETLWSTFDNISEGCQIVSPDWRYIYINTAAAKHGRSSREQLLGRRMMDAYPGIDETPMFANLRTCLEQQTPIQMENPFEFPDGSTGWFSLSIEPVPQGVFILSTDITQLKRTEENLRRALDEKQTLVQEVHHRVKNNLALVISLLNMEARRTDSAEARTVLTDAESRVQSMALVHEQLYRSEDLASVAFDDYLKALARLLGTMFGGGGEHIRLKTEVAQGLRLPLEQAIPCGLLVQELVTNSLKHAFPEGKTGTVTITLAPLEDPGMCRLAVHDDGIGMPSEAKSPPGIGLALINSLAKQVRGSLETSSDVGGTTSVLVFPRQQD